MDELILMKLYTVVVYTPEDKLVEISSLEIEFT